VQFVVARSGVQLTLERRRLCRLGSDDVSGTAVRTILAIIGRKALLQCPLQVRLAQRGQ
jgi:hypothetical protein